MWYNNWPLVPCGLIAPVPAHQIGLPHHIQDVNYQSRLSCRNSIVVGIGTVPGSGSVLGLRFIAPTGWPKQQQQTTCLLSQLLSKVTVTSCSQMFNVSALLLLLIFFNVLLQKLPCFQLSLLRHRHFTR